MTLKLKALGLALVAVLAISVLVASSASASRKGFTSTIAFVTVLVGEQDGATGSTTGTQIYDRGSSSSPLHCTSVELNGMQAELYVSTLTLEAEYPTNDCHSTISSNIHSDFVTDECSYVFTNTAEHTTTAEIECNKPGGVIRVTPTAFGSSICTITVPEQAVDGHVILHNIENGDVTAEATITSIESTRHGSSLCGPTSETDGTYSGNMIITGFNEGGEPTDIESA